MRSPTTSRSRPGQAGEGQILALFAISAVVIILAVGLVVDGGNALMQRRASQNASDFAALAGARIVAEWIDKDATNGTDLNVRNAIAATLAANNATVTYGSPNGPRYIDSNGAGLTFVGNGTIPTGAAGVTVSSSRTFSTYLIGIVGMNSLTASSTATARGGFAAGPPAGTVFPAGISLAFFQTYPFCPPGQAISGTPGDVCYPQHLTPGNLNVPGGFGWLKFGATGKCAGFGLGMSTTSGCDNSKPFLQTEIGPPSNSFGCCTAVNGGPSSDANPIDRIGSLPGNKASADCSYYIDNQITVTVPIWDYAGGTGANAWYHIVGFAGFQLTACDGGKDIEGVWRRQFTVGPTTTVGTGTFETLAVQLIK